MKLAALLGSITLAGLAAPSNAGVMPATAGHSWPVPDSCMRNPAWDQIINGCADGISRLWIIPTQVDTSGFKRVFAAFGGPNSSNRGTTCQAMAISFDNFGVSFSTKKSNFEFVHLMDLGSVIVPTAGSLHFECSLTSDSRVMSVQFL